MQIAKVGYAVRCMILDAMKMFHRCQGKAPTELFITKDMEDELTVHLIHEHHLARQEKLREKLPNFLGLKTTWDARDFELR